MSRRALLRSLDRSRIEAAIKRAEHRTSGEIRVALSTLFWGNAYRAAERAFARLGMDRTTHRNAVLIFVVPARRRFVVIGDVGIHQRVGQAFWNDVIAAMAERFRSGDFTEGLVHGIELLGERLREHFPYDAATDRNELPDDVDMGDGEERK